MVIENRHLVYKSWNGQVHTSIEYGDLTDGEGRSKPDPAELKRIKLNDFDSNDLSLLKALYPLEEVK